MIVFGVCALGVGALYLVPGVARSPEQVRRSGAHDEPTNSALGVGTVTPGESASAAGDRNTLAEGDDPAARTASGAQPTQSTATRPKGRSGDDDDRSSGAASSEDPKVVKDSEPPQPVADIEPSKVTRKQLTVNWPAATDNVGVVGYRIWLNGFEVATTVETKAKLRWFNDGSGQHVVQIRAIDAAGNQSRSSPTLVVRRPSPAPTDTPSPDPSDPATPNDQSSEPSNTSGESSKPSSGTAEDQKSTPEDEQN
jgi:hypothetical protein